MSRRDAILIAMPFLALVAFLLVLEVTGRGERPLKAHSARAVTDEDTRVEIVLDASAREGARLSWHVRGQPENGELTGFPPKVVYVPARDFHGTDSFTFVVRDGERTSKEAVVKIAVRPVNDPPTAQGREVTAVAGEMTEIALSGRDPDGDRLKCEIVRRPRHGAMGGVRSDPATRYGARPPAPGPRASAGSTPREAGTRARTRSRTACPTGKPRAPRRS